MPKRRHRKSWDAEGTTHHLTFTTFGRQPFFSGRQTPGWFLEVLEEARTHSPFHLFAYVIMPEHVHLVLYPYGGAKMRNVLWRLKRPMTQRVIDWVKVHKPEFLSRMADVQPSGRTTSRFWLRGGGYDRNLRSVKDIYEKIAYIHDNPVRRRLVARAEDWPHSSARAWICRQPVPVTIDWDHMPDPTG